MREVDRLTTEKYGIPSILLMENAAHAAARVITEKLGGSVKGKSILILCGKGNNGGDGAALGRMMQLSGANVELVLFGKLEDSRGDARTNFIASREIVGDFQEIESAEAWRAWCDASSKTWDVTVDAIFGTGLNRPVTGWLGPVMRELLHENSAARQFNQRLLISIDLPSGLIADNAHSAGEVFESEVTVTFTAPKPANVLPSSYSLGGELIVADIGSPFELIDIVDSRLFVATARDAELWLFRSDFTFDSYKNKRGHALIIAGSTNYVGAAVLCGNAAMRSGVGLVTIATPQSSKDSVASRVLPEVMVRGVAETENGAISESAFDELDELLEKADSVAVGSGLAQDESTKIFVNKVVENRRQPTIVDADALNLLSPFAVSRAHSVSRAHGSKGQITDVPSQRFPLILTPHEGEFMRLIGTTDKEAINDRVAAVRDFATKHNVILVLKGERVLIGGPDGKVVVNPTGNSGLGKAGNGDTLTGILAGFIAQAVQMDVDIFETVVAAVYVAGMAGDIAEKKYGKRVMTASDVRECLAAAFHLLKNDAAIS